MELNRFRPPPPAIAMRGSASAASRTDFRGFRCSLARVPITSRWLNSSVPMSIKRSLRAGSSQLRPWIEYCIAAASSPFAPPNCSSSMLPKRGVARHGKLPPRRHEELPPPWITEERANERGTNQGKPVVERSTGAGDEDAGRCGGDVAPEGVRVGSEADCAAAGLQPSHGEGLRGGGRGEAVEVT